MVLTFVIIFIVASAWDVRHVNRVLNDMVKPRPEADLLQVSQGLAWPRVTRTY